VRAGSDTASKEMLDPFNWHQRQQLVFNALTCGPR
jgi:hypothetical protein